MMNQQQLLIQRNILSLIKFNSLSGSYNNCFKINLNETDLHRETKFKLCVELIKRDFKILTECVFKDGNRADVLAIKGNRYYIFEIVNTESEKLITRKINEYDINFELIFIYTNKPLEEQLYV